MQNITYKPPSPKPQKTIPYNLRAYQVYSILQPPNNPSTLKYYPLDSPIKSQLTLLQNLVALASSNSTHKHQNQANSKLHVPQTPVPLREHKQTTY